MSVQEGLRSLASQTVPAPWDYDLFEQRRARTRSRRRAAVWGSALSVLMLALVGVLALVTQPQRARDPARDPVMVAVESQDRLSLPRDVRRSDVPALVDLSQFALTSEIEDHIALLDDEMSRARFHAMPSERLRQLQSTRDELNESLQRVSYAHNLLSL